MYALIGILKKPPEMSVAEFRRWWLDEHAAQARLLPRLRRYDVFPLVSGFDSSTGRCDGAPSHDGVAFLWFDSKEDLEAAFASAVGRKDIEHGTAVPIQYLLFCTDGGRQIPLPPAS